MKKEEKKSDWYWEIGDKKTNKPTEVIAWLMVEKAKLEEENENLKSDLSECECSMHFENDEVGYRKRECKRLNIKIASLEGEIKGLNYTIEKLKEENQTLELWLDNKEKLNDEYRKEIDKLRTDNIYEEGLYD